MIYFVSTLHVLLCVFMMFVILLQPGKDAGMGAALGGGAATSAFGGRGAVTFLGKVTAVCAIGYFMTSLGLSFVGLKGSVASTIAEQAAKEAAAKPPEAPKPTDGAAKPTDTAPGTQAAPPANDGKAVPTDEVQQPSDKPGTPVPAAEHKIDGTEGVPADKGTKTP